MVTKNIDNIFLLCRQRLYGNEENLNAVSTDEFNFHELFEVIEQNNLEALLYPILKKINDSENVMQNNDLESIGFIVKKYMLGELKKNQAIRILNSESEKRGLKFIFFKGIILADLYPQYAERFSSDSDILVGDEEREAAELLLRDCEYEKYEEGSKKEVQVYYNKKYEHVVELHTRLWEDYEGPKIEVLKKMNLSCPKTNIRIKACGIEVNTLGYEQHLVYQLFHIIKHFSLNGIGIRYLIDITLFVNKYFDKIDWNTFWNHMCELGYTKFVEAFFRICITELEMTNKVFEYHDASFDYSVDDLKMDLLKVGNINDREAGWQIMGAMEAYFTGEAVAPKSKLSRQLSMMFPSAKALPKMYGYAKKYPALLPIAWIHRDIKYIMRKSEQKDEMYTVSEKIEKGERRLRLIEELGLTDS